MPESANNLAINLSHVEKIYRGRVHALRGIQMHVNHGEIFGLLGPNGAGKSTLVKIMMSVVRPTRAQGTLLGKPVGHKPTLRRVGYLPEHHRFPRYLTGRQTLDYFGALADVPRTERRKRADDLLKTVGMSDWADKKVSSYSKGMMQRVGLAQAMINNPDLIVLDEPTDGVDPVGRREIRDVLIALKKLGKTVFLNSHLLSELEMVCDRVAILVQGSLAMQGTINELTIDSQRYEFLIEGLPPAWLTADPLFALTNSPPAQTAFSTRTMDSAKIQSIIDRLRADNRIIISVKPMRETLEDLFMRAVTDPSTGRALQVGAAKSTPPASAPPTNSSRVEKERSRS